jgi:hypothetical protein
MTLSAIVNVTDQPSRTYTASDTALEAVRFSFNPSALEAVTRIKALSALFIAECEGAAAQNPAAGREFAVAKTEMQTASMWAVLGATKGL